MQAKKQSTHTENTAPTTMSTSIEKQFARYDLFSLAPNDVDTLDWWKSNENVLPQLAKIAKSVLSIACSSAKSGRVFSCAGNFSNKKRNIL